MRISDDATGFFALNNHRMTSSPHLLAELWREYALSDSRYLTRDAFTVVMEAVTAFLWGPLSFATAYCIARQHPARQPLQMVVSLGQLYGDVLYYGTALFEFYVNGRAHCRPEGYYFWGYFVLLNAFWIVVPGWLLGQSLRETVGAFRRDRVARKVVRTLRIGTEGELLELLSELEACGKF
jgi:cholestenol Delta-isomerase